MLVFPFRSETLRPLEWAQKLSDSWKLKYFKGLVYLGAGNEPKGRDLWESCGKQPDFYPFYFARAEVYEPEIKATVTLTGLSACRDNGVPDGYCGKYFLKSVTIKKPRKSRDVLQNLSR